MEASCVLPPQKQPLIPTPFFIYFYHIPCIIPNYIQYCFACSKIYTSTVIFLVFCYSLISLFNLELCLLDSSMLIFVTVVHSFEQLYSISFHKDTIIYLSLLLVVGTYNPSLADSAATSISTRGVFVALVLFCLFLIQEMNYFQSIHISWVSVFSSK